eukprot:TRINITY_DN2519_c0_g5_i3.p1 TRINITY_DN2519_c0_g5~~TRINITY_DN2519_c0_g5_i3.p1  ORF type:complete len:151 (+),score=43.77 TRINITY_DN2519_c0_g5_i3:24-476(+)
MCIRDRVSTQSTGDYTHSDSGSVSFTKLDPGQYTAILADEQNYLITSSEVFSLCEATNEIQPPKIKVKDIQSTSVTLKLKPSDDTDVDFYQLRISYDDKTWFEFDPFSWSSVKVTNMIPGTKYYFQGKAGVDTQVWSTWGDSVEVTTKSR